MKTILVILILILTAMSLMLIFQNLDFRWQWQTAERELAECTQELINSNQSIQTALDKQKHTKYLEEQALLEELEEVNLPLIIDTSIYE